MKHVHTFESFTYENQEVADFVQKFNLTDTSLYDKDMSKFIKKVIKLFHILFKLHHEFLLPETSIRYPIALYYYFYVLNR